MQRILEFVRSVLAEFFPTVSSPSKTRGTDYKTPELKTAYKEGQKAFVLGGRRVDNPYARGTAEFVAWDRGYLLQVDKSP